LTQPAEVFSSGQKVTADRGDGLQGSASAVVGTALFL
jgi:hypothetical protein